LISIHSLAVEIGLHFEELGLVEALDDEHRRADLGAQAGKELLRRVAGAGRDQELKGALVTLGLKAIDLLVGGPERLQGKRQNLRVCQPVCTCYAPEEEGEID